MTMRILLDRPTKEALPRLHRDRVRAWADERHVPTNHIDELRQFVETGPAQDSAKPRDARIISYCALRPGWIRAISTHRAQLEDLDHLVVKPKAFLYEENWSSAVQLNQYRGQRHQGAQHDQ